MVIGVIMTLIALGALLWAWFAVRSARRAACLAREQSVTLAAAVKRIPAVVAITNAKGELEYVNPMFEKVTGYSARE